MPMELIMSHGLGMPPVGSMPPKLAVSPAKGCLPPPPNVDSGLYNLAQRRAKSTAAESTASEPTSAETADFAETAEPAAAPAEAVGTPNYATSARVAWK